MGESTISRIISDLNFPPLWQNPSPKCKQTSINLSPKFVLTLRCYISSELREPPNEREETRTPIASFHTNDVSNDVILTNHTQDTMMTFTARRNIFYGQPNPETSIFSDGKLSFAPAFIVRGSMTFRNFHANPTYIHKFQKTAASIFTVKTNEITRKHLILCSSVSDKWQKTLKTREGRGTCWERGCFGWGK